MIHVIQYWAPADTSSDLIYFQHNKAAQGLHYNEKDFSNSDIFEH